MYIGASTAQTCKLLFGERFKKHVPQINIYIYILYILHSLDANLQFNCRTQLKFKFVSAFINSKNNSSTSDIYSTKWSVHLEQMSCQCMRTVCDTLTDKYSVLLEKLFLLILI